MTDPKSRKPSADLDVRVASQLEELLAGVPVGSEFSILPSSDLCYSLELFMPRVLRRLHPEWSTESCDGIFVARALKIGPKEVDIAGACILISDQTVTPFRVELLLSPSGKAIRSFRVRLGEPGGGRLGISGPSCNSPEAEELLSTLPARLHDVDWSYDVADDHRS